jgi:glycosyltransferase involved in cell wall biosynthesis
MTASSVLLITPRWARDGGVGAHVVASASLLAEHGVAVTVAAARIEAEQDLAGVALCHAPALFDLDAPVERRLGEALLCAPQVVHLHQLDDPEVVRAARAHAPVVVSAHAYTACTAGVHYFRPGQECTRAHGPACVPLLFAPGCAHTRNPRNLPAKYRYATRGLAALREADLAVSYSSAVDRHLAQNGVARRAIVPYFPTIPTTPAAQHAGRRRVVFCGRVVPPKGVDVLLRAARELDGELVICGDGRQLEAMHRLAGRLGVAERVRFTGWLDPAGLAEELAGASVLAVPSVWPEPFGLVGIEAHAAGRPAVASATGGIGDWLEHGVSGLCVAPGDPHALAAALEELLSDPERQHEMGQAGRASVAARFSPERHVTVLQESYRAARATWEGR